MEDMDRQEYGTCGEPKKSACQTNDRNNIDGTGNTKECRIEKSIFLDAKECRIKECLFNNTNAFKHIMTVLLFSFLIFAFNFVVWFTTKKEPERTWMYKKTRLVPKQVKIIGKVNKNKESQEGVNPKVKMDLVSTYSASYNRKATKPKNRSAIILNPSIYLSKANRFGSKLGGDVGFRACIKIPKEAKTSFTNTSEFKPKTELKKDSKTTLSKKFGTPDIAQKGPRSSKPNPFGGKVTPGMIKK